VSRLNASIQLNSLRVAGPLASVSATEGERQLRHSVLDAGHLDACVNASIHSDVFAVPDTVCPAIVLSSESGLTVGICRSLRITMFGTYQGASTIMRKALA
jgi:hypothetical protein